MKKVAFLAATAAAFVVPAAANAQAYVQAQAGLDSVSIADGSSEGLSYGAAVGFDVPTGDALFFGIQASAAGSTVKECYGTVANDGVRECSKAGRDLALVARVGTDVGDLTKLYLLGGYANARARATLEDKDGKIGYGKNFDGWRVGAGFEHDFGHNLFGKVEYAYTNYEYGFSRHNGVVGLGVKF